MRNDLRIKQKKMMERLLIAEEIVCWRHIYLILIDFELKIYSDIREEQLRVYLLIRPSGKNCEIK